MEDVSRLNQQLVEHFGIDTSSSNPIFRLVWAPDQTEMRLMDTLDSGIQLLHPVVREVKKYSYIPAGFVLERLVVVPDFQVKELAGVKLSYEPIWVFVDQNGDPIDPIWEAVKLVVDTLYAALGKKSLKKYTDSQDTPEAKEKRLEKLTEELFGDASGLYGKTTPGAHEGITVPSNYGEN